MLFTNNHVMDIHASNMAQPILSLHLVLSYHSGIPQATFVQLIRCFSKMGRYMHEKRGKAPILIHSNLGA